MKMYTYNLSRMVILMSKSLGWSVCIAYRIRNVLIDVADTYVYWKAHMLHQFLRAFGNHVYQTML